MSFSITKGNRIKLSLLAVALVGAGSLWLWRDHQSQAVRGQARGARLIYSNEAATPNYQEALALYRQVASRHLERSDLLYMVDAARALRFNDQANDYSAQISRRFGDDVAEQLRAVRPASLTAEDEATEATYRAFITTHPDEAQGYIELIGYYERTNLVDEAYRVAKIVPATDTSLQIVVLLNLADVSQRAGDAGRAKAFYGEIVELDATNQVALGALARLADK